MADIKRPNYFNYQFLVEKDFEDEQAYHLQMRRRHNRLMHTPGIADGFTVTKVAANQVRISAGTAVDRDGREIVLEDARVHTLVTGGNNVDVFLAISYQDITDPADRYTQGGVDDFTRITERPRIEDSSSAPPVDSPALLLARIRLNATGVIESDAAITTSVRVLTSAKLAPRSVVTAQIGDGAVTLAKLASEAQPTAAIVDALGGANRIVAQINAGSGIIARTRVEPEVVSSVVSFQSLPLNVEVFSNEINPGFGPGVVGVQLGLDDFDAVGVSLCGDGGFGRPILLRSLLNRDTGTFRIFATRTAAGGATQGIRVRWHAFRPQLLSETAVAIGVSVTPAATSMAGSGGGVSSTQVFTATVSNATDRRVNWTIAEANGGTLSGATAPTATSGASVIYTSPALSGTYNVVATSVADSTKSAAATVTVTGAIAVNPSLTAASLIPGQFVDISADVINTANKGITWTVTAGGGTFSAPNSPATRYTAPTAAGTYTVTATSVADTTKKATITMNVVAVTISAAADSSTIDANATTTVRATVGPTFLADKSASWLLISGAGSISGQGLSTLYRAPSSGTTATIRATSVADTSKSVTVSITVNPPPPPPPGPPGPPGPGKLIPIQENLVPDSITLTGANAASTAGTAGQPRAFVRPQKRAKPEVPPESGT